MQTDLIERYDLRVPRYTSYPTAPHFGPEVDGARYREWLTALDPATALSLYLHIPYCAQMCFFCGCHTKATKKYAPVADYLKALADEIGLVSEAMPERMRATHIHFGGGSPTILAPRDFRHVMQELGAAFDIAPGAEIAVELDPRTTSHDFVGAMAEAGVTRVSIGVQDFNPTVQRAIGRVQSPSCTARVIGWLRGHGIEAINMDLVYGLPYQTVDSLLATIDLAAEMAPSRIALFGYAHVPWMKTHQRMIPVDALPGLSERWRQYEAAGERLKEHGYVAVGLDHFALPDDRIVAAQAEGALHRNFQGYTTDAAPALIGLGASGIGALPQGYVANEIDIGRYKAAVRDGRLPIARGVATTGDDRLRREIIERLMCDMRVDLDAIAAHNGFSGYGFEPELSALAPLEADGIVQREGHRLSVTEAGRPLVRAVCAVFDRYLDAGEVRHSKAV
ncbi:MAG: oxygen-independent coproporphyrinogen III oxidase [Parvibaculum sp.]|uniref:oxygen-independent coproporphyrinogen III oxidase n=1 Tax=Parvibaculum sp. TaxID=2024848 RepID=UPI00284BC18C|nr:oxygen-independent coproporphyrinogen III oxidase [Parvibaculum sp.]MDR3497620.1 oxygen-independent coproporphyrinogen III oxidase [Parvibaculum sp.]